MTGAAKKLSMKVKEAIIRLKKNQHKSIREITKGVANQQFASLLNRKNAPMSATTLEEN